jgi:hypothetical protein
MTQPGLSFSSSERFRQPQAVFRVGLVPPQRLGMHRVDHRDLLEALPHQRAIHGSVYTPLASITTWVTPRLRRSAAIASSIP